MATFKMVLPWILACMKMQNNPIMEKHRSCAAFESALNHTMLRCAYNVIHTLHHHALGMQS